MTESLRYWTWSKGSGQTWQYVTLKSDMARQEGQDGRHAPA